MGAPSITTFSGHRTVFDPFYDAGQDAGLFERLADAIGDAGRAVADTYRRPRARAYRTAKRSLDVLLSVACIAICWPLAAAIVLAIRFEDGGPALFTQTRVGRDGRRFSILKFRTMVADAESRREKLLGHSDDGNDVRFKMRRDPRLTMVGRFLRRFSLDEFPQVMNVLRGEMTFVGPRPPLPSEVEKYTQHDEERLCVKPGLTCIWQVSGRADVPFEQQVEMDLDYIARRSTLLDIWLLCRTVPAVITGKGAY